MDGTHIRVPLEMNFHHLIVPLPFFIWCHLLLKHFSLFHT